MPLTAKRFSKVESPEVLLVVLDSPVALAHRVALVLQEGQVRVNQVSDQLVLRDKLARDRVVREALAASADEVVGVVAEAAWVVPTTHHQCLEITKSTTSHVVVRFM